MNKNMGNHKRKGPHRGQQQPKGKGENEIHGQERDLAMDRRKEIHRVNPSDEYKGLKDRDLSRNEPSADQSVNREREKPRHESWTLQKTQEERKIQQVESSGEKIQPREKETHRMVSWNKEHKDRERKLSGVEKAEENKPKREVEIQEAKSQAAKNTDSVDGYEANRNAKMYNQDLNSQAPPMQAAQEDHSLMEDIRSAPSMEAVLYTVAVLLVIGWVIGFFFYNAGDLIHVLLVLALFAVLIKVVQGRSEESG